ASGAFLACGKRPGGVAVGRHQVLGHGGNHPARNLRPAGTIEIGHRMAVVRARERREVAADLFDTGKLRHGHTSRTETVLPALIFALILSSTREQVALTRGMRGVPAGASPADA